MDAAAIGVGFALVVWMLLDSFETLLATTTGASGGWAVSTSCSSWLAVRVRFHPYMEAFIDELLAPRGLLGPIRRRPPRRG